MILRALLLLLSFALIACPAANDDDSVAGDDDDSVDPCDGLDAEVTDISPDDLLGMLDAKDFELINVHIPYAGEIEGTDVHIPYTATDDLEEHLGHDLGAKAVLYCLTGPMSATATADLADLGYCRIYDMPAGLYQWEQLGYPTN
jgi:rhodanese-related sulfurtransferase